MGQGQLSGIEKTEGGPWEDGKSGAQRVSTYAPSLLAFRRVPDVRFSGEVDDVSTILKLICHSSTGVFKKKTGG